MATNTLPTSVSVGHQWTKSTNTGCNQWLSLAKIALKVHLVGRNRSLVANTSRCGEGIRGWSNHKPPSVTISNYNSVRSGGPTFIFEHNPQQSHGWNRTESLVWLGHEQCCVNSMLLKETRNDKFYKFSVSNQMRCLLIRSDPMARFWFGIWESIRNDEGRIGPRAICQERMGG